MKRYVHLNEFIRDASDARVQQSLRAYERGTLGDLPAAQVPCRNVDLYHRYWRAWALEALRRGLPLPAGEPTPDPEHPRGGSSRA